VEHIPLFDAEVAIRKVLKIRENDSQMSSFHFSFFISISHLLVPESGNIHTTPPPTAKAVISRSEVLIRLSASLSKAASVGFLG